MRGRHHVCGCYHLHPQTNERTYLPQVKLDAHTTILSTASCTVLTQKFMNTKTEAIEEIRYAFPLFDGVSVVDFACQVGDCTIYGLVKEKGSARKNYEAAKARRENAALLEQLPEASDIFTTTVSKIPAGSSFLVTITYVQELKHDAEVDGVRLTFPTSISPRYGSYPGALQTASATVDSQGISLVIDVSIADRIPIKKLMSPSHPIEVTLGTLSTSTVDENASTSKASATLALGTTELEKDFVLQLVAKDVGIPQAILETHPTRPNQRALMTTLVPKFNLKSQKPEIIFIADRSGSMQGHIPTLVSALKVFLKSIPVGCMFNVCSFGSDYSFLWPKSQVYGQDTLNEAIKHVEKFGSDFGGTETLKAVEACFAIRHKSLQTELMLLTDGDIWSQQQMFDYISEETKSGDARVFPIGIGGGVSSALIEGVARAGRGFAQMVADGEKLESKIVRMLKGALTPHIKDYRLEVKYEDDSVDTVAEWLRVGLQITDDTAGKKEDKTETESKPISLYDPDSKEEHPKANEPKDIFAGLPKLDSPKVLQTPVEIPSLFPFHRTCVYLLLSRATSHLNPKSVVLKGTSPQGPLELEIPVQVRQQPDQIIHQLAARKAMQELEEGRGWMSYATLDDTKVLVKDKYPAQFSLLQRREAVRLGVEFQINGKYCSFVAIEADEADIAEKRKQALDATVNRNIEEEDEDEDWEEAKQTMPPSYAGRGKGLGRGGAYRHRRIAPESSVDCLMASETPAPLKAFLKDMRERVVGVLSNSNVANTSADITPHYRSSYVTARSGYNTVSCARTKQTARKSTGGKAPRMQLASKAARFMSLEAEVDEGEEEEEEDEEEEEADEVKDMGFGLFDGDDPATGVAAMPAMPARKVSQSSGNVPVVPAQQALRQYSLPRGTRGGGAKSKSKTDESDPLLKRLITRQSFEGAWTAISDLLREMNIDLEATKSAVEKLAEQKVEKVKAEQIISTAIVVVYLQKKMEDEEETWELIAEKARDWLNDVVVGGGDLFTEVFKVAGGLVGE